MKALSVAEVEHVGSLGEIRPTISARPMRDRSGMWGCTQNIAQIYTFRGVNGRDVLYQFNEIHTKVTQSNAALLSPTRRVANLRLHWGGFKPIRPLSDVNFSITL